jgi:hypothetical protein
MPGVMICAILGGAGGVICGVIGGAKITASAKPDYMVNYIDSISVIVTWSSGHIRIGLSSTLKRLGRAKKMLADCPLSRHPSRLL